MLFYFTLLHVRLSLSFPLACVRSWPPRIAMLFYLVVGLHNYGR
jgi:hypothetical protein